MSTAENKNKNVASSEACNIGVHEKITYNLSHSVMKFPENLKKIKIIP